MYFKGSTNFFRWVRQSERAFIKNIVKNVLCTAHFIGRHRAQQLSRSKTYLYCLRLPLLDKPPQPSGHSSALLTVRSGFKTGL